MYLYFKLTFGGSRLCPSISLYIIYYTYVVYHICVLIFPTNLGRIKTVPKSYTGGSECVAGLCLRLDLI